MEKIGNIQYQRNFSIPGIEACRAIRSPHRFPNHSHEDLYAFSFMEEGGSSWDGRKADNSIVRPGSIAAIPAGQVHSGTPLNGNSSSYRMLYIKTPIYDEVVSDIYENTSFSPEFSGNVTNSRELCSLFSNLYEAVAGNACILQLESAAAAFLAGITAELGGGEHSSASLHPGNRALDRAADFLSSDLDARINLEQAAAVAGLSKYHFLRSFKSAYGVSPHLYRTQKRVETAKELIKRGVPFSEIAFATGFTDQSHFTNQFRKFLGVTPGQYLGDY